MNILNLKKTNKKESEKALEKRLVDDVRKRGGIALKLTGQFHRGMPDRLVLLPYRLVAFCEMKSTGELPTELQELTMKSLRLMGFPCYVIDTTEALEEFLDMLDKRSREAEDRQAKRRLATSYAKMRIAQQAKEKGTE